MYYAPARLRTLAELEQARGHLEQASELYQRATDIVEGLIAASPDQEARASLMAEMSPIFIDHFAIAAHRANAVDAFRIIEQVRGRIVAEKLLQPSFDQRRGTQTEDAIRRLKVQLVQAQTTRRRRQLVDRLFFAEQARWTEASQNNAHPLDSSVEVTLPDVQRHLHANEVVLEYVLGDTDSFCLQISRSNARITKLVPRAAIESHVHAYSGEMKARRDVSSESRSLFESLIQPLHLPATWNSIIIVPDGVLHTVPFSALEDRSGGFLISSRAVSFVPSAGTLALLRARRHSTPPKMFLGVGGVEYSNKSESVMLADAKTPLTRGDYYGVDFSKIPNLPGTEEEIHSAAGILGAADATLLTGRSGTETEFKSARLNQFRIIHLAVHGKANAKNPDRAALIFRPDPPQDDGLLEPREILALHLNADLVVLSACDTAVGHLQGEEGIANLARAFLMAGSQSVVSTLWPIDDTYSLFLMKRFYTHLRDGVTEAEALRLSQAELVSKFGKDTPVADWAAFTLLGDGDRAILPPNRAEVSSR